MKIKTANGTLKFGTMADKEENRAALAKLKARMIAGDLRPQEDLKRDISRIVELATGVRP